MEQLDRLWTTVLEHTKIVLTQTAHVVAARVGYDDGDRHQLGMDADDGLKEQEND